MTTAAALLAELIAAGILISRRGDRLHVEAPVGTVTPALRERLAANKPHLLAMLHDGPSRAPTSAEAAELRRLVGLVYVDDGPEIVAECLAVALADVARALRCYRHLAALYAFDIDTTTYAGGDRLRRVVAAP